MKKKLPIARLPIVTYPNINAFLGISLTNEKTKDWFYNKFVQIYATIDQSQSVKGSFIDANVRTASCPFVHENEFERSYIDAYFTNFKEFVKHCIDSEQYVYAWLNRYYIKPSEDYKRENLPHPLFIIGYDDETQMFYAGDFFYKQYRFYEISYQNIEDAYQHYAEVGIEKANEYPDVCVFRYNQNASWNFSFELLIISLEDYLNERDSSNAFFYVFPLHLQKTFRYGLGYYNALKNYLEKESCDMRTYHILYEHKKMMNLRLMYLEQRFKYINRDISNAYREMEILALQARNQILKASIKSTIGIQDKLMNILITIEEIEQEILPDFISDLKSFAVSNGLM